MIPPCSPPGGGAELPLPEPEGLAAPTPRMRQVAAKWLAKVWTPHNPADLGTKPVDRERHALLCILVGLVSLVVFRRECMK